MTIRESSCRWHWLRTIRRTAARSWQCVDHWWSALMFQDRRAITSTTCRRLKISIDETNRRARYTRGVRGRVHEPKDCGCVPLRESEMSTHVDGGHADPSACQQQNGRLDARTRLLQSR